MGSKRLGLARVEKLLENLKREINWGSTTFKGQKAVTETLSSVGTTGTPTKTLVAADSGTTFFIDCGTVSVVCQLPTPAAGLTFKFILATASDNEATKDFLVDTGSDSVDMGGNLMVAGAIFEVTSATSALNMDGSGGALTVGDWLQFDCDGTDWYVQGSVRTASAVVINDAYAGITPA